MAYRTTHPTKRRVNSDRVMQQVLRRTYEDGNAVRVLDIFEEELPERAARSLQKRRAQQRRVQAHSMSAGYVLALTAVCIATLFLCIHYLQLRSQVIHQSETIAGMETTLSKLKADNDAYENKAQASLNMEDVKETALNKLGLHYATESQIRYYNADNESYVRQYELLDGG